MEENPSTSATLDDVLASVQEFADDNANGFDGVSAQLSDVLVKLDALESSSGVETSGTVTIDVAQIDHLESGLRVLASTAFVSMTLLAVLAGLAVWRIISRAWHG